MTNTTRIICAIVGIVILEVAALLTGHDGTLLRVALVAVAGLGGFSLANVIRR
jgi:hypothetical protein